MPNMGNRLSVTRPHGFGSRAQVVSSRGYRSDRFEGARCIAVDGVIVRRHADDTGLPSSQGMPEDDQATRGTVRERRKQHGLPNAENRSAGAYAERHHDEGEAEIVPDQPERVSEIFGHTVKRNDILCVPFILDNKSSS
jgi:hypothetical protein